MAGQTQETDAKEGPWALERGGMPKGRRCGRLQRERAKSRYFKTQKFILSIFCQLEVQNRGVSRALLSEGSRRESVHGFLFVSGIASNPWHPSAWRLIILISASIFTCSLCVSSHVFPLCLSVCVSSLLERAPVRLHQDPPCPSKTSSSLITSALTPFASKVTF